MANPDGLSLLTREELEAEGFEIVDMEFHGPITPGGPDVSLSGTVDTIYNQVLELNPDYDAWEFPDHVEYMTSLGISKNTTDDEATAILAHHTLAERQGNVWSTTKPLSRYLLT